MDTTTQAGLIDTGGQVAGGLLTYGLQMIENQKNRRFNAQQAELAYQRQIALMDKQNAYNTPLAQMQRYKDAGLNPNLVAGQSNISAPAASAPQAAGANGSVSPLEINSHLLDAQLAKAQIKDLNSSANSRDELTDLEIKESMGETIRSQADIDKVKADCASTLKQTEILQKDLDSYASRVAFIDESTREKRIMNDINEATSAEQISRICAEAKISEENAASIGAVLKATIAQLYSQVRLNDNQRLLNNKTMDKIQSEIDLNTKEQNLKDAMVDYYNACTSNQNANTAYLNLQKQLQEMYGDDVMASEIYRNLSEVVTDPKTFNKQGLNRVKSVAKTKD